jgi:hypothetical protein
MMGGGSYSMENRAIRSSTLNYATSSVVENFPQTLLQETHKDMDPVGIDVRESRDLPGEHECAVPIAVFMDVTGSMQQVPQEMIADGLPTIMGTVIQRGIPDPQLMICAIGDHTCDRSPIQVSQFESSDELIDREIQKIYVEGNGGGNSGESYLLAWYFATYYTVHDHFEKRGKRGYLFTIGDEPCLDGIDSHSLKRLFGSGQHGNYTAEELLKSAKETYHVYHFHILETRRGQRPDSPQQWERLLGDNFIPVQSYKEIAPQIAEIICEHEDTVKSPDSAPTKPTETAPEPNVTL